MDPRREAPLGDQMHSPLCQTKQCLARATPKNGGLCTTTPEIDFKPFASVYHCPLCFGYAVPRILQCPQGHVICDKCRQLLLHPNCPICDQAPITIRNLGLDNMASFLPLPCKYSELGCSASHLIVDKAAHELACQFRPANLLPCLATSNCCWSGPLAQYRSHFLHGHGDIAHLHGGNVFFQVHYFRESAICYWAALISYRQQDFVLFVSKKPNTAGKLYYYITVQHVGVTEPRKSYECLLEIKNRTERLTFAFIPDDLAGDRSLMLIDGKYLMMTEAQVDHMSDGGCLSICIKMTQTK